MFLDLRYVMTSRSTSRGGLSEPNSQIFLIHKTPPSSLGRGRGGRIFIMNEAEILQRLIA